MFPDYPPVYRSLEVPKSKEARRAWLDEMAAPLDTDFSLDFSGKTDQQFMTVLPGSRCCISPGFLVSQSKTEHPFSPSPST